MYELEMAKIIPEMGFIASRGQKLQRLVQQYCIIDDDAKYRHLSSINPRNDFFDRQSKVSYISWLESMIAFDQNG